MADPRRGRAQPRGEDRILKIRIVAATLLAGALVGAAPVDRVARQVHEGLVVLDTHLDTPANLGRPGWSIMDRHVAATDGDQVDYPRLVEGGVDGGFWVIYTPQGERGEAFLRQARDSALTRAIQIRSMVAAHPTAFALALTADDAARIAAERRRAVYISMENSAPVEGDLSLIRTFRAAGVTMMGPVHFRNNGLADSATDKPEWNGLSPKGQAFVTEANRLGIVIDASHASDEATRQMVARSPAPIILSHSGMRAIFDHPRNVTDADARLVAAKGGVIQINAFSGYMIAQPSNPARDAALRALAASLARPDQMTVAQRRASIAERKRIDAAFPIRRATLDDLMKHILHAIRLVGIDHVGLSGDFDGGGGVEGFDDVTDFPKVTAALLSAGYTGADLAKFWSGNTLRVMRQAQALAEPGAVPPVPTAR